MIVKQQIMDLIADKLEADGFFAVDVTVKPGNKIEILIDSKNGVPIEYCIAISRLVEHSFDREEEDFELEVSSPGIGQPFKVLQQYQKSLDRLLEVMDNEGKIQKGILEEVTDSGFVVKEEKMVKPEGKKKKELQVFHHHFSFDEVKRVKEILSL